MRLKSELFNSVRKLMTNVSLLVVYILANAFSESAFASDVEAACGKSDVPVLELDYRMGESNSNKIRKTKLGDSPEAKYVREFYNKMLFPFSEKSTARWIFLG